VPLLDETDSFAIIWVVLVRAGQGIEERYSIFVLKSTLVKALRHFPHLDPNGNGPRPTSHLETPSVSELSLKVDEASGSAQPTTSSFDGDEDVEEDDGGDENWEDAEEGSGDDGEWEDHDDELDGKGGGAIHYAWEDWAERTRMLQNLRELLTFFRSLLFHLVKREESRRFEN